MYIKNENQWESPKVRLAIIWANEKEATRQKLTNKKTTKTNRAGKPRTKNNLAISTAEVIAIKNVIKVPHGELKI